MTATVGRLAMVAALSLVVMTDTGLVSVAGVSCRRASKLGRGEMCARSSPLWMILGSVEVLMHVMEADWLGPMAMMPLSTRSGSPWHSTVSPGTRERVESGGRSTFVKTCLEEQAGIVIVLAQERTGKESVSSEARSICGVVWEREKMWPPLKEMELLVKSALALVALRKSVPRMHSDDRSDITNAGKSVVLPSGVTNLRELRLVAARVAPAAEVMVNPGLDNSGAGMEPSRWIACSTAGWMHVMLAPLSTRQETGTLLMMHLTCGLVDGEVSMAATESGSELWATRELTAENSVPVWLSRSPGRGCIHGPWS